MGCLLSIRNVSKSFGSTVVLDDISLDIAAGEFLTFLGESGSGKTTLLRIVSGFEQLDGGEVWMNGERIDQLPPNRRGVNTVFQQYALFPHMSVFDNVAYGLRARKVPATEIMSRVEASLAQVNMRAFSKRFPSRLSGGQQQRVALARALVNRPKLLLLDEPFSALDANLRKQMQSELKSLQREVGIAFVFVTHDQQEALALSDRIALLRHGKLEQVASPRTIYNVPRSAYCATFIGHSNLLKARVTDGVARSGGLEWPADPAAGDAVFSLRPEHIRIVADTAPANPDAVRFRGTVLTQFFAGAQELLEVQCEGGVVLQVRAPNKGAILKELTLEFPASKAVRLES